MMLAEFSVLDFIAANPTLGVAVAIVLIGLLGVGLKDLLRFSVVRLWAISNVCFTQALRRRVLLVTPLVMLGVVIGSQFQRALDPQDAIRQTTLFCLFATGLVVTLLTIILACTNIPKEIETRVIYTIATKPATRLEIIVGKVVGFGRVSFCILAVMGIFTWSYLTLRDWQMRRSLAAQLSTPGLVDQASRATLERYRDEGMLHARELGVPRSLSMYSHLPASPDDRWVPGADGEMMVPFMLDMAHVPVAELQPPAPGMGPMLPPTGGIALNVAVKARPRPTSAGAPATEPSTQPAQPRPVRIEMSLTNRNRDAFLSSKELNGAGPWQVPDGGGSITVNLTPSMLARLVSPGAAQADLILSIWGVNEDLEFTSRTQWVSLLVREKNLAIAPSAEMAYVGRAGMRGQELRGGHNGQAHVAVFQFRNQKLAAGHESYPVELRMFIERLESDEAGRVSVRFVNRRTNETSPEQRLFIESNRPAYLNVPASAVAGGDFDVILRSVSDAVISLHPGEDGSVRLVRRSESFAWNLTKSLLVLWLMSLLVIIAALFTSTFVSWPIAIVLTTVILCGRWGAEQVADMTQPGVGRTIVNDMMRGVDAPSAKAIEKSVDAMVALLRTVAAVLPDISRYAALEDIQRGVSISAREVLAPALQVTLLFGLPMIVLAYVFLKFKEVAP